MFKPRKASRTGSCRMLCIVGCLLLAGVIGGQAALGQTLPVNAGPEVAWSGNNIVVNSSKGFVAAINSAANRTTSYILIGDQAPVIQGRQTISLTASDLVSRPVVLSPGTNVTVASAPGVEGLLDFGGLPSVLLVSADAVLQFENMWVTGWATPNSLTADYPYPAAPALGSWPTVAVLPGSQVSTFNVTSESLYASCVNYTSKSTIMQLEQLYGAGVVEVQGNALTIRGLHGDFSPLYNYSTKAKVGEMWVAVQDTTGICVETPAAAQPVPPPGALPASSPNPLQGPQAAPTWFGYRLTDGALKAVVVTNSSGLAQALQDGELESIAIADPLDPAKAGHIIMQAGDWGLGQRPVSIQPGRSVTITSVSSQPAVLDLNNLVSAMVVTANATLSLFNLDLQNLASHRAAEMPYYTFNRVRELQIWPSIALEANSEVMAANLSLTAPQDNCTLFMATATRQAQALFGADNVSFVGTTGTHYKGSQFSNVSLLDPITNSVVGYVGVHFTNFTRCCTDDTWGKGAPEPDANRGPGSAPAPTPGDASGVGGIPRLAPRQRLAASSAELAALLRDPTIEGVLLLSLDGGPINLSLRSYDFSGALGPVAIQAGRTVRIQPASTEVATQLDFNSMAPAILINSNATLIFQDLHLRGLASPRSYNYTYYPQFLGMWPTMAAQQGATIHLINTTSHVPGRTCQAIKNQTYPNAQQLYGSELVRQYTPTTVSVLDNHTILLPINDYVVSDGNVPSFRLRYDNTTGSCLPNEVPPAPPPAGQAATSATLAVGAPNTGGHSNAGLIGGIVGGVLATIILAGAAVAFLLWRRRRHADPPKLGEALKMQPSPPFSGTSVSTDATGVTANNLVHDSTEFHCWPAEQLQKLRLGLPEEESLEQGPLLGRGGFGKVYKGRWKGVIVAIKVVEHSSSARSDSLSTAKQRIDRESLLSTSLAHPNVISTYKICTVNSDRSSALAQNFDSASLAGGHNPAAAADLPPDPHAIPWEMHGRPDRAMLETWLILEFCEKGNLAEAVQKGRLKMRGSDMPDMVSILRCLVDIAAGMEYLHTAGILHGDLKTANVLLKSTGSDPRGYSCKLADFGLSRIIDLETRTHVSTNTFGTITYMPPELLTMGHLTKAADVYSFGIIMSELYSMQVPFDGLQLGQITVRVVTHNERPGVPDHCPEEYRTLMNECWSKDPHERPTFPVISERLQALLKAFRGAQQQKQQQQAAPVKAD